MDNNKNAIKSGIWYIIANFAMSALTFLTTPVFARLMTKSDYGVYSAYSSWVQILGIVLPLNFSATMVCAKYDYSDDFNGYAFSCMAFSAMLVAFWCVVFNFFSGFFTAFFGLRIEYINFMMAYLCFLPTINIYLCFQRSQFEYKKAVLVAIGQAVGTALLGIVLVVAMDNKLTGRIAGASIPTILMGLTMLLYFARKTQRISLSHFIYGAKICIPLVPNALSLVVLNSVDRVMINDICGAEDAAYYSLAYTCSMMITVLVAALNDTFFPWLADKMNEKEYSSIKMVSKKYILLFSVLVAGMMLLAPEIMLILGGKQYLSAKNVMPPIMIGCAYQLIYSMFADVEQIEKNTAGMACASVVAAALNCLLNAIFIPRYGYVAAAYTTMAGYLALVVMHMFLVKKLGMYFIYDNRVITLVVIGSILFAFVCIFLYARPILRCIVVIVLVCGIGWFVINRKKEIVELISSLKRQNND